jgi:16S rRNA (cytosine1402-N4)-methyltransferase
MEILDHRPVMLNEMMQYLAPTDGEYFLDCTFGAGGYSDAILSSCLCELMALDQDPEVQKYVSRMSDKYRNRFHFHRINFANILDIMGNRKFDGIIMDLGMSSMQVDSADRGFSFTHDGPLDMRMSNEGMSASDFINNANEKELADIIYKYGDEILSRRIARRIITERMIQPITSTGRFATIVRRAIGFRKSKIDTATKTFQAIRIYINNELQQLEQFLDKVNNILNDNGRLIIVSFHSLEDFIVKNFLKANSVKKISISKYATINMPIDSEKWLRILTKKPISPSENELFINPRSRSAKLRAAIK